MKRLSGMAGEVVPTMISFFLVLMIVRVGQLFMQTVPATYDRWYPIIRFGYVDAISRKWQPPIQKITRDDEKACWSLYMEKTQPAKVKGYEFFADGGDTSAKIPTAAYLVDDDNNPLSEGDERSKLKSHDVGKQWHRRWCFNIAKRIPDFKPITISGEATHSRWPHLWETHTPTPEFTVCPLRRTNASACRNS